MKILITGGSGYLGSHLAQFLGELHEVSVLVRDGSSSSLVGTHSKVFQYESFSQIRSVFESLKPDVVINTVASYGRSNKKLESLIDANITYPSRILSIARDIGVTTFIHTGTSLPDNLSLYALTKNTFVNAVKMEGNEDIQFIDIALEHFYGPGDDVSKFASFVLHSCRLDEPLKLTSGLQQRDFIYIDDVLAAFSVILSNASEFGRIETIAVGSGCAVSLRHLVETIHECSGSNSDLDFGAVPMRQNELMYSCADITKLSDLGWSAVYSLRNGVDSMIKGS